MEKYLGLARNAALTPPFAVFLSVLNVKGFRVYPDRNRHNSAYLFNTLGDRIDAPHLVLDEIIIEDFEGDLVVAMRPIFDTVWNAAGWSGAPA